MLQTGVLSLLLTPENLIPKIEEKESIIDKLEQELLLHKSELQHLKDKHAKNTPIKWRESIRWCLEVDAENPYYFIKNTVFVAKCIAGKHKLEITRDIKNKISTTLSLLFNEGEIGRVTYNGATYYGLLKFFKTDRVSLKKEYEKLLPGLRQ